MDNRKLWVLAFSLAVSLLALADESVQQPASPGPPSLAPMPMASSMPPIPSPYREPSKKELLEGRDALEKRQGAVQKLIAGNQELDKNLDLLMLSKGDRATLRRLITTVPERALQELRRIQRDNAEYLLRINGRLERLEAAEFEKGFEARLKQAPVKSPPQALTDLLKAQLQQPPPPPSPARSSYYAIRKHNLWTHRNRRLGNYGHEQ